MTKQQDIIIVLNSLNQTRQAINKLIQNLKKYRAYLETANPRDITRNKMLYYFDESFSDLNKIEEDALINE